MRIKSGNTGDKSGLALCSKEVGNPIESVKEDIGEHYVFGKNWNII